MGQGISSGGDRAVIIVKLFKPEANGSGRADFNLMETSIGNGKTLGDIVNAIQPINVTMSYYVQLIGGATSNNCDASYSFYVQPSYESTVNVQIVGIPIYTLEPQTSVTKIESGITNSVTNTSIDSFFYLGTTSADNMINSISSYGSCTGDCNCNGTFASLDGWAHCDLTLKVEVLFPATIRQIYPDISKIKNSTFTLASQVISGSPIIPTKPVPVQPPLIPTKPVVPKQPPYIPIVPPTRQPEILPVPSKKPMPPMQPMPPMPTPQQRTPHMVSYAPNSQESAYPWATGPQPYDTTDAPLYQTSQISMPYMQDNTSADKHISTFSPNLERSYIYRNYPCCMP